MRKVALIMALPLALTACSGDRDDPRGVGRDETLLSVSASGEAETRPDQARFEAGINTWASTARAASDANLVKIQEIVTALKRIGIVEKDIQTRVLNVQRIDWGDRKGQFQASNVVKVTVRKIENAGAAVAAATSAGANIVSGPDLRLANPEQAATSAYTNAYRAARARAQAYADAADMRISRVLSIRDAGGIQGNRYLSGAAVPAPQAVRAEQSDATAGVMAGQTTSAVAVQVDFALEAK